MNSRDVGKYGEKCAVRYLKRKGYRIISQNVFSGKSETDIIATDGIYIIFAEVKTRRAEPDSINRLYRPASAVDYKKQECLIRGAARFIRENPGLCASLQPRIDVVEVYIEPKAIFGRVRKINHIENAVRRQF